MVNIMEAERVQRLDLPMTAYMENVERFGQGMEEMLKTAERASQT